MTLYLWIMLGLTAALVACAVLAVYFSRRDGTDLRETLRDVADEEVRILQGRRR